MDTRNFPSLFFRPNKSYQCEQRKENGTYRFTNVMIAIASTEMNVYCLIEKRLQFANRNNISVRWQLEGNQRTSYVDGELSSSKFY
jgi:hypothetical protein